MAGAYFSIFPEQEPVFAVRIEPSDSQEVNLQIPDLRLAKCIIAYCREDESAVDIFKGIVYLSPKESVMGLDAIHRLHETSTATCIANLLPGDEHREMIFDPDDGDYGVLIKCNGVEAVDDHDELTSF